MGSCYVDQAGLELMHSSDSPASASRVAASIGVHHHAQLLASSDSDPPHGCSYWLPHGADGPAES